MPPDLSGDVAAVAAGGWHSCALTTSGAVRCWGRNGNGQTDVPSELSSGVSAVAAGGYHSCALTTSGALRCWGSNGYGQLGNGNTTNGHAAIRLGQALDFAPGTAGSPLHSVLRGQDVVLSATATGGGVVPIVFDTWTPDTCTVSGSTLQITGPAGSLCGVRASRAGGPDGANGTTAPAPQQLRLLRIARNDTLSVNVTGQGSVDVAPDPAAGGIDACTQTDSPCTAAYGDGDATDLTLTATPDTGWHLTAWSDDCSADAADPLLATLTLDADRTCTASFMQNAAAGITAQGGDGQSTPVLAAFTDALAVRVADAADVPLAGITVSFAAPGSGASATLSTPTAITDASGIASITATANGEAGSYAVTASVAGVAAPASFALTNTPFSTTLALTASPAMLPPGGTATLSATVTGEGSLIPGGTVDFYVDGDLVCAAVPVDGAGIATCEAGPFPAGAYTVSASYSGDAAHAPATSGAGIGFGVSVPAMVPVNGPWALALLIAIFALVGTLWVRREGR